MDLQSSQSLDLDEYDDNVFITSLKNPNQRKSQTIISISPDVSRKSKKISFPPNSLQVPHLKDPLRKYSVSPSQKSMISSPSLHPKSPRIDSPSNARSLSLLKRNTIFGDKIMPKQPALIPRFSLLKSIVKSQTHNMTKTEDESNALAILGDYHNKFEARLFQRKSLKIINFTPVDWKRFEGLPLKPGIHFFKMFTSIKKTKVSIEAYHKAELTWDEPMVIEKRFPQFMNQTYKVKISQYNRALQTIMSEEQFQNYLSNGLDQSCIIQTFVRPTFPGRPAFYRIVYRNQNVKQSKRKPNYGFLITNKLKNVNYKEYKKFKNLNQNTSQNQYSSLFYHDSQSYTQKHIVNVDQQDLSNCEIYMIRNFQVLEHRLEEMAQELINFINGIYGFRIKQVVVDFIKDSQGNYYLTDLKNFTFDEFEKIRYLRIKHENPSVRLQNRQQLLERACLTYKCSLCLQKYQKNYVQNTITKKMLYKLNAHLTKRGVFLLQHLEKYQFQQEFCKVCDQCNLLVIAELELMEVERLYAIAQNIPSKEYNKIKKDDDAKIQIGALHTNQLTQWRLMFMFKEIKGVSSEQVMAQCQSGSLFLHLKILDFITSLEISKANQTKQTFIQSFNLNKNSQNTKDQQQQQQKENIDSTNNTYQSSNLRDSRLKLNSNMGKKITIMDTTSLKDGDGYLHLIHNDSNNNNYAPKLNVIYEYQETSPSILINKIRVHFFFTQDNNKEEFWKFLSNTEIEIRLTDGPYWEGDLIGTCTGFPLQYFNDKHEIQLQPWQYYFFGPINKLPSEVKDDMLIDDSNTSSFISTQRTKYDSMIDFTVSLKKDQKVQISNNVDLYQVNGVLFPENNYFSPLPMPKEWIEIIQLFSNQKTMRNSTLNYNNTFQEHEETQSNKLRSISPNQTSSKDKHDLNNNSSAKKLTSKVNDFSKRKNSDNELIEFGSENYDGIKNTPFSKDMQKNFSHSLKIFKTVQDQELLSKKLSNMNSVSPIFRQNIQSRNKYKEALQTQDQIDITDDHILLQQLKLIDTKNQTLREVNTHYDPKFIYSSSQAVKKLQQIKKQKEKLQNNNNINNNNNGNDSLTKFGGKQDRYKFKNYQIEHETILNQRKQVVYQLKKKNYQAIKDIIKSKKQQMLNIIPDDNFIIGSSPQHKKFKINDEFENKNLYGDSLTVTRKNSLKNARRPSMIETKISTEKLNVYEPLYVSQKTNPQPLKKSNSIVKQKNSNILAMNRTTNIFHVVSQTFKDYERSNQDLKNYDILTPRSKKVRTSKDLSDDFDTISKETFDRDKILIPDLKKNASGSKINNEVISEESMDLSQGEDIKPKKEQFDGQKTMTAMKPPLLAKPPQKTKDRIQSAQVSNKNKSQSIMRTTFYNSHSKISKISPKNNTSTNSSAFKQFLPYLTKSNFHSTIEDHNSEEENNNTINQYISNINTFQATTSNIQGYNLSNMFRGTINEAGNTQSAERKISKGMKRKKRHREFQERYGGILLGDLRKGMKNLTRSQQHISKDLETSLKKTSVYQEQIIKVYGIEGEKQLVKTSLLQKR
ncbi:UNKNOWN [Stylonychia lemnae]|uniref:Uncharacterized protein n=1 Tax=Stylonychia lemnae TaxID=5949 RepID=A0A077ZQC3_STYLE|nr:UNKNOWN [Stylonychia lemnae]|eukprot:CDW71659.1 UNKNOWN [Stylonychia lemnae]